jgi:hypothetical protein
VIARELKEHQLALAAGHAELASGEARARMYSRVSFLVAAPLPPAKARGGARLLTENQICSERQSELSSLMGYGRTTRTPGQRGRRSPLL